MRTVTARVALALLVGYTYLAWLAAVTPAAEADQPASSDAPAASKAPAASQAAPLKQVPGAHQRWAPADAAEVPNFERHIIPLVGKLGCSNRACHGSFQGQNGFSLSLFGHDPQFDFDEMVKEEGDSGRRVDLKRPDKSLVLSKPINGDEHGGGQRMEVDSWQYRLFRAWVAAEAPLDRSDASRVVRLDLEPAEIRFDGSLSQVQLKATAYFADNTYEDVTPLTIFSTNDDAVATVSEEGLVKPEGNGDTAIVATFAGVVVTSQVLVPVPGAKEIAAEEFPPNNPIDQFVLAKLNKLGIPPSGLSSDEAFLRRVYVDVIGTLPTAEEARRFLADGSPDRRARLIDELLQRDEYAMYWATKFDDWTGNDSRFTPNPRSQTAWLWHNWLRAKLQQNLPYDELVGGFLTATTREGRSVDETLAEHQHINDNLSGVFDDLTYGKRQTNDIFWKKAGNSSPNNMALRVAYAFLGVRLECAQCHKHPFDRWTQDDFKGFSNIFAAVGRGVPKDVPKDVNDKISRQQYRYAEVYYEGNKKDLQRLAKSPPKVLGGEAIAYENGEDPRAGLWQWMRADDNPFFAKAIANRIWGHYFGVGIVEPVDDFNAANPPSNPQLLDWLAEDFIAAGFDLKHLHRTILNSRTYQLSWVPNESNRFDERNFSHALLRRMPAEAVLDAINQITGGRDAYSSSMAPRDVKTINLAVSRLRGGGPEYALGIFGRPIRTQTCDCERSSETGLAQAMFLLNDAEVNSKIADPKGRVARLLKKIDDDRALIEELYLSVLSRYPSEDEMRRSLEYAAGSASRAEGMQDILWSLMNLREFIFVH